MFSSTTPYSHQLFSIFLLFVYHQFRPETFLHGVRINHTITFTFECGWLSFAPTFSSTHLRGHLLYYFFLCWTHLFFYTGFKQDQAIKFNACFHTPTPFSWSSHTVLLHNSHFRRPPYSFPRPSLHAIRRLLASSRHTTLTVEKMDDRDSVQ